jgi:hypothetical protein
MTDILFSLWPALAGGLLIGLSAAALMALNGRILGISGITAGALGLTAAERGWRRAFLAGLGLGGLSLGLFAPQTLQVEQAKSLPLYLLAGLLVGYGVRLSGGCTSGHGVCGLSRLSPRALLATLSFMGSAMLTVWVVKIATVASA